MKPTRYALLLACLTAPALGAAPEKPDAPEGEKPNPGRIIKGVLTPPERVLEAYLRDRGPDTKVPIVVDPKTGAFEATGLKLGTYDLVIRTPWGRLEGLDMAPTVSEYDALIPEEYRTTDLGGKTGGALDEADLAAIRRHIHEVKRHENRIRDLRIEGDANRAVALVELMLDQDFVGRKGDEVIWRVEQWYYEKNYDAWTRFRTRVLTRRRVSKKTWATWGWMFEPKLGGLHVTEERAEPIVVAYRVPEKPDPAMGLAGTGMPPADRK